jgi:phosphoribosylformimino-5-aminoimidazole carboxamide ribotide isomerase
MQVGGGISVENARSWLEVGASHVIVTSYVFRDGKVDWARLNNLLATVGRERLVLDLSCRKRDSRYYVVTDRWTKFTDLEVGPESLRRLSENCAEFLVHAVDVEGLCAGVDRELIQLLAQNRVLPTTYAGGVASMDDVREVAEIGQGLIDITVGSALDIFGGRGVHYAELLAFNRELKR